MVRLYEKVDATMAPETQAESAALNIKSQEGVFRRKENYADFTKRRRGHARRRPIQCRSHRRAFGADRKSLMALEGQGAPFDRDDWRCSARWWKARRFFRTQDHHRGPLLERGRREWADQRINFIGDTGPAHAVIEGPPNRDLVAHTFRVGLANKQVTDMKADDNVVMKETAPIKREMTSGHLDRLLRRRHASRREREPRRQRSLQKIRRTTPVPCARTTNITNDQVVLTGEPRLLSLGHRRRADAEGEN